ncbi:uncharacterized protein N7473_013091 [Penicillium subrubescens]|uniref:Uncharacterized protein n=1 Tax=Penicillium subrubescens TaxID=1316194 RepID=A0A1Q5UGN3_9EURO|nr:uncharacterized protein N7473_013091 [Penicillium subrubescens]KAJ5875744.1 hypothetical protein N7473_013091 [Penicillium subrubescens]OKP11631.1 hypothetical protein PENSUB_2844 [Penicillium subrubescens]
MPNENEDGRYVVGSNRNLPMLTGKGPHLKQVSGVLGGDIEHVESLDSLEKSKTPRRLKHARANVQKHWRRFWCCYLVAAIIFLAIFLPVFFLVAVPAIAQRIVDDTNLPVYSAQILDPKTQQVSFTLDTSLNIPMGLRIRIDPLDLSLFNRDVQPMQPYLTVSLPSYSLKGNTNLTVTKNNTDILNEDQFIKTLTQAVYNKKFTMSAKGSTVGHLGALKAPLTLNKDIELDGLDKLSGFSINSARVVIPKEADGTNLVGEAILPNHSDFTFALGNVTLNLRSSDLIIGQATILNVLLKPGNNTVALRGRLEISTVLDNLSEILSAQKTALGDGEIELSASGNSTIYNGVHIKYYEQVLKNLTLVARVPILQVVGDTLDGLLNNTDSGLGKVLSNITQILGNISSSSDTSVVARSLRSLV